MTAAVLVSVRYGLALLEQPLCGFSELALGLGRGPRVHNYVTVVVLSVC